MKVLKIFVLLFLFIPGVRGQFVSNNKRIGDIYFRNKDYYAAATYYKKALQVSNDSIGFVVPFVYEKKTKSESPKRAEYENCVFQLATSLRLYKDFRSAEAWYALTQDFSDQKYILGTFYYGECLRANQKFTEAISAFDLFLKKYKPTDLYAGRAKLEIASCNFALYEMRYPRLYKFSKLYNQINDKGSNYTPLVQGNNFYFTSSRPVAVGHRTEILENSRKSAKVTKKESPYINAIYESAGGPLEPATTVHRLGPVETGKEYAAPAFSPDGTVMYLTSWTAKGTRKICEVNMSAGTGATWSAPRELGPEVNVTGFNSMQPFVSKDGKYLIFSSDRPGGFGKYDLWYCSLRADGSISQAANMGSAINTQEDEEAGYYNSNTRKLIYSSAGKVGLGGLDFYESEGEFAGWTEPRNLGYPFNSSKDDVYFTPLDEADSEGYISSDRESVCCLEIFHMKKEFITIEGTVFNCANGKPLEGAMVTLRDSVQSLRTTLGADGKYKFRVSSNRKLSLTAEKSNYFTKVLSYDYNELAKTDTLVNPKLCLAPFHPEAPIVLTGILYDYNSYELRSQSKNILDGLYTILADNPTMEIELGSHTDNIGSEAYNLDLSEKRAQACVDYLASRGIDKSRMKSKGYGFSKPVAPDQYPNGKDNVLGRQLNRRTEFTVIKK